MGTLLVLYQSQSALVNHSRSINRRYRQTYRKMMLGNYNNLLKTLFLEYGDFLEFY